MIVGLELLLQFYLEKNLQKINDYQLNIEYVKRICYCCLLKNTVLQSEN